MASQRNPCAEALAPVNHHNSQRDRCEGERGPNASSGIVLLHDTMICYTWSFLHLFNMAGPIASVCRQFREACYNDQLCAYLTRRDHAPEKFVPLPAQPLRDWANSSCTLGVTHFQPSSSDCFTEGEHSKFLRQVAARYVGKSHIHIANVAAKEGRPALLYWAAQRASLEYVDTLGRSALMVAAANNKPQSLIVASSSCEVDRTFGDMGTALHMAAYVGAAAAVDALRICGADLETTNGTYLQTPLHVACSRDHVETVKVLLEAKADHTRRDKDGMTAARIARGRSPATVDLLHQVLGQS